MADTWSEPDPPEEDEDACEGDEAPEETPGGPVELPIDGTLDLHGFHPREVGDVVADYLEACLEKGIRHVRIVHGKGIGNLRRTVHAVLSRHPRVVSFQLASLDGGSWGATLVTLAPAEPGPAASRS